MSKTSLNDIHRHLGLIDHMLAYRQYRPLFEYLQENASWHDEQLDASLRLAQAYLAIDLARVEELAPQLNRHYLLKPTFLERRVYCYSHYMNIQYKRNEYMDYFRALSPLLVDLFRLVIEHDFLPQLNRYIHPIIKENEHGAPVYKGLQWKQSKIEAGKNIVDETFTRYYGNRFNYNHYLSSSHLVKLIIDHSDNQYIIEKCKELRQVEKFVRNIIAHEVIHVTDRFVKHRSGLSIDEVHELIIDVTQIADLKDKRQWDFLKDINQTIKEIITEKIG